MSISLHFFFFSFFLVLVMDILQLPKFTEVHMSWGGDGQQEAMLYNNKMQQNLAESCSYIMRYYKYYPTDLYYYILMMF